MSEARFWKRLRDKLPTGHYVRIENLVGPGTFDVNFCVEGTEGFFEMKYVSWFPARPSTPVLGRHGLSPEQMIWVEQRLRAGGRAFMAIGVGNQVFWFPGSQARELNDFTESAYTGGAQLKDGAAVQESFRKILQRNSFTRS